MSTKGKEDKKKNEKKKSTEDEYDDLEGDLKPEELSEEDTKLKEELELLVTRTADPITEVASAALVALKKEIRSSTSSMTSVPKPLKFLTAHYDTLKSTYEKLSGNNKNELADVISWLGMTLGFKTRDCLNFKLKGTKEAVSAWGHEYVRHLCLEIGDEHQERVEAGKPHEELDVLVDEIVPFLVTHNAEPDACDILMEVEQLPKLINIVDETNYKRICLYLESCANYLSEPDDTETLKVAMKIFHKVKKIPETLRIALALDDREFIQKLWDETEDQLLKKQLALMLGQHGYFHLISHEQDETLQELMGNGKRAAFFQHLAKDLDIEEPKTAEDIYKSNLEKKDAKTAPGAAKTDSARQNLATTFVNAFVNAGFSKDKLMTVEGAEGDWVFKNREHGRISAVASLGMINLWDPDTGANAVDRYSYMNDDHVKAGVMLGVGIVNANVRNIFDIAFSFMQEHANTNSSVIKQCIALGLGISYAGSGHAETHNLLLAMFNDGEPTMELLGHIALALGLVHIGSCHPDLTEQFVTTLIMRGEEGLKPTYSRYLCLGLGLLYLGKQEAADVTIEALKTVPGVMGKYAVLTVETCAYAGTGNVLKIQKLLAVCSEHLEDKDNAHQAVAILGIALVALREDIGRDMVVRSFDHLLQYGEVNIRRAVPLALGILSVTDPDISIMDTLSKFSHDHDAEVAMGAIFGLGLIGAGTNNSRIATLLRGLASYYHKEPNQLFVVRIAQGILHAGKGTMTISPFHSGNLLTKPSAMAALLTVVHTCFDFKGLILGKAHYMLYTLALAMSPRMLLTLNENLEPHTIPVRVGQAVDVIGKAGNPKTITGFQTHNTPVLLTAGDKAEFATDEFLPASPILEGCVILKPNPDAKKKKKR